jgi:uncharacterized damage-inducible protein DinB
MPTLAEMAFSDLEEEISATRRLLERLPQDKLTWKPHAKSNTLGELATHVVSIVGYQVAALDTEGLDFSKIAPTPPAATREELLHKFEKHVADLRRALARTDDSAFEKPWTLRVGDHVIFTRPRRIVLRSFGMSHLAHHRGQLTVYLRLLDVPLPPVYGPTADER